MDLSGILCLNYLMLSERLETSLPKINDVYHSNIWPLAYNVRYDLSYVPYLFKLLLFLFLVLNKLFKKCERLCTDIQYKYKNQYLYHT